MPVPKNFEHRIVLALTTTIATTQCGIMGFGKASIITTSLVIYYNVTAATLHKSGQSTDKCIPTYF